MTAAHLLAADRLAPGSAIAGNCYFITNGEPIPLWEMVNRILAAAGLPVERVNKVAEGRRHIVDMIIDGEIALIFNTTEGWQSLKDSQSIRASALSGRVPYFTTAAASLAAAEAIEALRSAQLEVRSLQDYYS